MTTLKFISLLCGSLAALLFGLYVIPDVRLFMAVSPPVPITLLAVLFLALAGVLLAVALSPVFGRLRSLRHTRLLRWIRPGALVPLLLLFLAFGIATPQAEAQLVRMRAWTNLPSVVTANGFSNVNANPYTLQFGRGVGVAFRFATTNATGCTNLVALLDTSHDGTNWTTGSPTPPLTLTSLGTNGTSQVIYMTNLLSGDGARLNHTFQIRVRALTNAGGSSVFLSNAWWIYNP